MGGTTCQVWQNIKCDAGYKHVNGSATSDANCVQCSHGQFQPFNQFTGTSCTNWKQCNKNEYISLNGNRTSDRICELKPTTTTTVTSATPASYVAFTSAPTKPNTIAITTVAEIPMTTTTVSPRSRWSANKLDEDDEGRLSPGNVNTISTISIIIVFTIVIFSI